MSAAPLLSAIPLGGLGHVGGNMMVYETEDDLVVIDCGVLFPSVDQPGIDYIIPDVTYLTARRHKIRGIVLTHGHEDHLGALPYVLPQLDVPVFGTRFTLALLESRLGEHKELRPDLRLIQDHAPFKVGGLTVTAIPVAHSIPDAVALAIDTPAGVILHTGDFKVDDHPRDGRMTDKQALSRLGDAGIVALFSDSTNAGVPGHTTSEAVVATTLATLVASAPHRVVVSAFSSNIHRLQSVVEASEAAGRKVVAVGRSMQQNTQLALERGYLKARFGAFVELDQAQALRRDRITVLASGTQGEPMSALSRLAAGEHGQLQLEPGDRVILSSRKIPGNERAIGTLVNHLYRLGVEVLDDHTPGVHASGHACADEQREMLALCRPRFFVPVHGEYRHLVRHAALARDSGVDAARICIVEDGQPVELWGQGADIRLVRGAAVQSGHVFVDGKGVGDVGEIVLRDRRVLAETGMVLCVVILREDGTLVGGPDIVTRGVVHVDANQELLGRATEAVRKVLGDPGDCRDAANCAEKIRQTLRRFFRRELDRRPLILPVVMSM
ncbi:MAG: ribonuclease J [Deltaproteobacteria bacterium]|nr:ribonuclease J [Deltaproteobacteria bacterium]